MASISFGLGVSALTVIHCRLEGLITTLHLAARHALVSHILVCTRKDAGVSVKAKAMLLNWRRGMRTVMVAVTVSAKDVEHKISLLSMSSSPPLQQVPVKPSPKPALLQPVKP